MRLLGLSLAIATLSLCVGARAQDASSWPRASPPRIECDAQPGSNVRIGKAVATVPWATLTAMEDMVRRGKPDDVGRFFDRTSDELLSATLARCAASGRIEYVRAYVVGSDFKNVGDLFWGDYEVKTTKWHQRQFNVELNYRVEQTRLNDLSQPIALAELARRTSGTVVAPNALWQNPFVYKGQVVALRTDFERMIDQDHAAFEFNHEIHVGGVPSTKFRSHGEVALVAVRITGSETVHGLLGDYAVPTGTYVDGLNCADLKCGLW